MTNVLCTGRLVCLLLIGMILLDVGCHNGLAEPVDNKALFDSGVCAFKEGRFQDAVTLFSELITMDPADAKAYKNRGVARMSLSEMDAAIEDFNNALRLNPDLKGLYSNLGAAWHYKGVYEKAIECYDTDISQRPDLYITYFNRALSKVGLNHLESALTDIDRALLLKPDFEPAISAQKELREKLWKPSSETVTAKSAVQKYAVQAGAFLVENNAMELCNALSQKGYRMVVLQMIDAKRSVWHVVRSADDMDHESAKNYCQKLRKENILTVIRPAGKL